MKKLLVVFVGFSFLSFGASNCSIYGDLAYEKMGGGCGCLFGFIPPDTNICVSGNTYCSQKFGPNASYSSGKEECSCQTGHEFASDSFGKTQCLRCAQIYGPNSEYFYLTQNCGCKEGYTLKNGSCEISGKSAYFVLQEYETSRDYAVVKSEYDNTRYLIEIQYSTGSTSNMLSSVGDKIVINTGLNYSVDPGDSLILLDKSIYTILSSKEVNSSFTIEDNADKPNIEDITNNAVSKELEGFWQQDAIGVANRGIIQAQANMVNYNVKSLVLRQEIIAMAVRIRGLSLPENYFCNKFYKDVTSSKPNNWVCRTAEIAANNGIISRENENFNPEKNVTRVESIAIIFNAFNLPYKNFDFSNYSFPASIPSWQKPLIAYADSIGVVDADFTVLANFPALRGEIFNYIQKIYVNNIAVEEIDNYADPNFISNFLGL